VRAEEPGEGSAVSDSFKPLADELLAQALAGRDSAELAERIVARPAAEALETIERLGRSREAMAAPILVAVAEGDGPRQLRKEARRGLHRLRAAGLEAPSPRPAAAQVFPAEPRAEIVNAWASPPDGVGSRVLWLMAARSLGGVYAAGMVLNDVVGMKACAVDETTRKRFNARLTEMQADEKLALMQIPQRYARQLVGEALELNRETGFAVPRDYQVYERALDSPALPFELAIVYEEISVAEIRLDPELLAKSAAVLDEEELKGWFFGFDDVRSFALDLLQARQSQIVLSEELKEERIERIRSSALRQVVTPPIQRALRRRLEEIAYVFLKTGRQRQARQALAAAQRLAEGALTLHPLLTKMMERSLEIATEVEMAKVPVDLVSRSPYDPIK
jgi:hypothetical protein